jgi:hypothetical protein
MLLKRTIKIACVAVILAMAALVVPRGFSQETSALKPPPYRGVSVHVDGIFVTPVPAVPLTAIVEVQSTQILADGSTSEKKTFNNIARDFQGRIYNERRQWVNPSFAGPPTILSFHIFDPVTRLNTFLDPATHLARQAMWPSRETYAENTVPLLVATRNPLTQEEDLGTDTMESLSVRGSRRTRTVPARVSGTGKDVVVTDEYWYSDELHLNMLVKHDDPRSGHQTVAVTHVDRSEPNPQTFQIPANYKVIDETPER